MKKVLFVLCVLALLVIGCNSQPTQQNAPDQAVQKAPAQAQQEDSKAADAPAQKEDTKKAPKANSQLKEIFDKSVKYKVTYNVAAAGTTSQMTQYIGNGNMRTDVTASGVEIRSYLINGEFNTCNKVAGSWTCQAISYTPSASDAAQEDTKANINAYTVDSIGSRTVAGTSTDCFRVTIKDGSVEYCYSKDYAPLYIKTTAGAASSELTATSYSTSVSDSDFELPAAAGEAIDPSEYLKNIPSYP